ncbi:MAG: hypothetical protein PHF84_01740 [bacterium]|nr:hypothetical protein [bacterium]
MDGNKKSNIILKESGRQESAIRKEKRPATKTQRHKDKVIKALKAKERQ